MQHHRYTQFVEPIDHYILENGHELFYVHRPNCGVAEVALMIPIGASSDTVPGAMHFYEHLTQRRERSEGKITHLKKIAETHGVVGRNAYTSWSNMYQNASTRSAGATEVLSAHIYNLLNPEIDDDAINRERGAILSEYRIDAQEDACSNTMRQLIGVNTKDFWQLIGDEESINNIDENVISDMNALITYQPLIAVIMGEADVAGILSLLENQPPARTPIKEAPRTKAYTPGNYEFRHHSIQSVGCLWVMPCPVTEIDRMRSSYLTSLIGGSNNGLLFHELRSKHNLVYGISAAVEDGGTFHRTEIELEGMQNISARQQAKSIVHEQLRIDNIESHIRRHFDAEKRVADLCRLQAWAVTRLGLSGVISIARKQTYKSPHFDTIMNDTTANDIVGLAHQIFTSSAYAVINLDPA